jgi:ubiquinone/menaquinone biosynthesis C-methylase UbiE
VNISEGSTVLDVGIGYGRNIASLANCKRIVGIDISALMIRELEKMGKQYPQLEFYCENAKRMQFPDRTFDYVICLGNTFGTFADDKSLILKEMKRVCKKEGEIYVGVYSENALECRIKEYEKLGIKFASIHNGDIYTEDGLKLEQFSQEKLQELFTEVDLNVKIIELNPISYMCIAN